MLKRLLFALGVMLPLGLSATLVDLMKPQANVVTLCNLPLNKVEEIAHTLKEGDAVTITYLPRESQHWRLVEYALNADLPESITSMYAYREEIERMGLTIVDIQLKRPFVVYANRATLTREILEHPELWPVPLTEEQINQFAALVEQYSMPVEAGHLDFPCKIITLVVTKCANNR